MKKIINILKIITLVIISSNSVASCNNKKKPVIKIITEKILQKTTKQQFADEIANIINKKQYFYKNENVIYKNKIKNYLISLIPDEIKIKNLNTNEFDKNKIKFENIDLFYLSEKEIKNIIVKYDLIKSEIKVNLKIIKKEENDLNKMINNNFGEIKLKNNIPNKTELVNYIRNNNFIFENINENDFEILKQDETSTIIVGKKKYIGTIKLTYKRKIIDLNNSFIDSNQNIYLNSAFFKKQNINTLYIYKKDVKKLIINYLNDTYGEFILQFILPDIDLEKDIELDFKDNIFPYNLENKKEIKFDIIGINNIKGKITINLTYLN